MLKVAFWVFSLLKSTKYELVLMCFNTPFNTMKLLTALLSTSIALAPVSAFADIKIAFVVDTFGTLQAVTDNSATRAVIGCDGGMFSDTWQALKIAYIIQDRNEPICSTVTYIEDDQFALLQAACNKLYDHTQDQQILGACEARFTDMD